MQKEGLKPPPGPAPEPEPREDVRAAQSPTRCPYCHDSISLGEEGWVACEGCLARHHQACWGEAGACSACGGQRSLVREAGQQAAAWEERLRQLSHDAGLPSQVGQTWSRTPYPLPRPEEGGTARALFGAGRWAVSERRVEVSLPPEAAGTWALGQAAIHLERDEEGRTLLRVGFHTGDLIGALYGGLVGGLGGGIGGGASVFPSQFGPAWTALWVVGWFAVAIALARFLTVRAAAARLRSVEALAEGLVAELGGAPPAEVEEA